MYYQAGNQTGNSNEQSWNPQQRKQNKARSNRVARGGGEGGSDAPMDGGLDGGLNIGSIVGSDGVHPLSVDRQQRTGYAQAKSQEYQDTGNGSSGGQGLQPLRVPAIGGQRGGGSNSPRAQQQQQQLQIQQQAQMQAQQQQQQQQQQMSRDVMGRRNRGTRHGNTRGRRQKYNSSAADGNHSQLSQGSMGGQSQVATQGQQGQQSGANGNALPSLTNQSRRQPQQQHQQQQLQGQGQQQQPQQGQQQQQQVPGGKVPPGTLVANPTVSGVPRENLPSYFEEHQHSSTTSIKGLKPGNPHWINQDNFFIIEKFDNRDINFYCVLDGHGADGHHVSRHCRTAFPQHIRASNLDMKRAFNIMQNDLNSCEFDVRCSGATCVLATLCGARLSVSNCGDSRAVLGRRNPNGTVTAHALTQDHKPDKPEERKRILACGGHLGCRQVVVNQPGRGPVSMPVGPCRVWYQNRGETLGLAMSRSLGDSIVHRSGVSAEPETLEHIVDEYDEFMIIATDGVWDVIDNNQAVQMVQNFSSKSPKWNPLDASNVICKFARSRWEKLSPMVDDITCIVVKLQKRNV